MKGATTKSRPRGGFFDTREQKAYSIGRNTSLIFLETTMRNTRLIDLLTERKSNSLIKRLLATKPSGKKPVTRKPRLGHISTREEMICPDDGAIMRQGTPLLPMNGTLTVSFHCPICGKRISLKPEEEFSKKPCRLFTPSL
jgi:hypothetical protein